MNTIESNADKFFGILSVGTIFRVQKTFYIKLNQGEIAGALEISNRCDNVKKGFVIVKQLWVFGVSRTLLPLKMVTLCIFLTLC